MDNRRFVSFLIFFFAFTYLYSGFIAPKLFPPPPPVVAPEVPGGADDEDSDADSDTDIDDGTANPDDATVAEKDGDEVKGAPVADEPAVHPNQRVTLGSLDPASGFFLRVELNSKGAAIESVQLADPKFKDLKDNDQQLVALGTNSTEDRTFTTAVASIDKQLKKFDLKLETIDWELVESDADHATFSFESPDHTLKLTKAYSLTQIPGSPEELQQAFLNRPEAFTVRLDLTVTNLSDRPVTVAYELQGPVGIVLENTEHTRKYRDIKLEFTDEDDPVTFAAKAIDKLYTKHLNEGLAAGKALTESEVRRRIKQSDAWTRTFRYAGVDVQFFAALVSQLDERPEEQRLVKKWIDRTYPVMIAKDLENLSLSDISFRMASTELVLEASGDKDGEDSATHSFGCFVGPKRSDLLDPPPLEAETVLDYGSWFGTVARGMHWILNKFHRMGMPYVLAIICLTALVRGCMFPISRKQAIMAAKQKALAPKLQELKLKHGDDKEKFAKAQMELWRKHGVNPLGGCLPAVIQLPVFIGLYTCLNTAVDLRLSSFLWIKNLAAPDAIASMPRLPFLGSDFNLLPCISVCLFLVQQKLFMPPPQDEQAEMTQKMMNMMTIVMGVMFWHVPAGLCIYFIASSLWGIAERKLLASDKIAAVPTVVVKDSDDGGAAANKKPGFMSKIMSAMEEAQKKAEEAQNNAEKTNRQTKGKGKGNKKKGR